MPALRPAAQARPVDEKITVNVGFVDLGQIDLLVQEGFYANRTDLIRTAIRNQIAAHAEAVRQVVSRRMLVLGIQHLSALGVELLAGRGHGLDTVALHQHLTRQQRLAGPLEDHHVLEQRFRHFIISLV